MKASRIVKVELTEKEVAKISCDVNNFMDKFNGTQAAAAQLLINHILKNSNIIDSSEWCEIPNMLEVVGSDVCLELARELKS